MATSIGKRGRATRPAGKTNGERSGLDAPSIGGLVGGVIGGLIGHYAGEKVADGANSLIDSHMDNE